jgi:hypothetical protein
MTLIKSKCQKNTSKIIIKASKQLIIQILHSKLNLIHLTKLIRLNKTISNLYFHKIWIILLTNPLKTKKIRNNLRTKNVNLFFLQIKNKMIVKTEYNKKLIWFHLVMIKLAVWEVIDIKIKIIIIFLVINNQ